MPTAPPGTLFEISFFENERDNTPKGASVSWPELIAGLSESEPRAEKSGLCWSPAKYRDGATRGIAGVESLCALVYDLDGPVTDALALALDHHAYVAHTTHTPGRWRIVLPLSRAVSPAEHAALWRGLYRSLAEHTPDLDPSGSDASRLFYAPSHRPGEAPEVYTGTGVMLDPVSVPTHGGGSTRPQAAVSDEPAETQAPPSIITENFDLSEIRAEANRLHGDKKKLFLDLLSGSWAPAPRSRDVTLHLAMCLLASVPKDPPKEALAASLLEHVLDHMECAPEGRDYWQAKAMSSFTRALASRVHRDELDDAIRAKLGKAAGRDSDTSAADWRKDLSVKLDGDGSVKAIESTGSNVALILANDSRFATVRWNVMSMSIEALDGPLKGVHQGDLDTVLSNWLCASEYRIRFSRMECMAQLMRIARCRQFDPVSEYIHGLTWDGTKRIDTMLTERCGGEGDTAMLKVFSRKFMISAIARALSPGCQVDTMLILVGDGGAGKTSFVRALGGPFAAETRFDPSHKDGLMLVAARWIVELSELASMRKADVETMRGFITSTVDRFRPPYGRAIEAFPRRCVMVGTTNDPEPLNDVEGARRYWPVTVKHIDVQWIRENRDQLWAEAAVAYAQGEQWWLTPEEQSRVHSEVAMYQKHEWMAEDIVQWLQGLMPKDRPAAVSLPDLGRRAFGVMPYQMSAGWRSSLGKALVSLGFQKERMMLDGVRIVTYKTPAALMGTEFRQTKTARTLAVLSGKEQDDGAKDDQGT